MAFEIKQYSAIDLAPQCSERLIELTSMYNPCHLFVSGGSCMEVLVRFIEMIEVNRLELDHVSFSFVDERFDPINSNFVLLKKNYPQVLNITIAHGATWIDTSPQKTDQYQMADWYEHELCTIGASSITLLGMGIDGHTAGILPDTIDEALFTERFVQTTKKVVGYDVGNLTMFPKRFTLTYPSIAASEEILLFVKGSEKRQALQIGLFEKQQLSHSPISFVQTTKQLCTIYTDITL